VAVSDDLLTQLQLHGAGSLVPAELLAILADVENEKAVVLFQEIGGIRRLNEISPSILVKECGSREGAARVLAAIELARRMAQAGLGERRTIVSAADVFREFAHLRGEKREHFCALYLDTKNNVLRRETIAIGALDAAIVHPREVFREAVREGASSIIVAHNHPSGDPEPSQEDVAVTRRLAEAGRLLGIDFLDHVIVGDNDWVSMKDRGVL